MLGLKYHLKGKKNFDEVLSKGKFVQSDSFGLAYLPGEAKEISLFGFVVSTKVSKHAVLRNRVKRAMSESVRYEMGGLKPGFMVVFLAKGMSLKKSTDAIMKEVALALTKTPLYKNK